MQIHIILPNHLFQDTAGFRSAAQVYLVEEFLFFRQYAFHQQKILFHRASMKAYEQMLIQQGFTVSYISAFDDKSDIRQLIQYLSGLGTPLISMADPCDDWLQQRVSQQCTRLNIQLQWLPNPSFLNSTAALHEYFDQRKRYYQTDFYIHQRKARRLLMEGDQPLGGKWSFDTDNRLRYPRGKTPPAIPVVPANQHQEAARIYVAQYFAGNPGSTSDQCLYPTTHAAAIEWLQLFLRDRLAAFGDYEDAIVQKHSLLHHSLLTPLLNSGLLLPQQVIDATLSWASTHEVPLNSLEGFIRQIIGWREFIRAVYLREGNKQRTRNFWKFERPMPAVFYTGETGIPPVDDAIHKLLSSGYNHHIERLMILSNFMLLCEIEPNAVYQWFMEMYIDAYDWVMVPNVYGMGQFADGGLMCTKPYISGSNYILKMSDYSKGDWCDTWDGLFWRFIDNHRHFFGSNPRLNMMVRTLDKMNESRKKMLLAKANAFLNKLA